MKTKYTPIEVALAPFSFIEVEFYVLSKKYEQLKKKNEELEQSNSNLHALYRIPDRNGHVATEVNRSKRMPTREAVMTMIEGGITKTKPLAAHFGVKPATFRNYAKVHKITTKGNRFGMVYLTDEQAKAEGL